MAVQTAAAGYPIVSVFGDQRSVQVKLASVANNDTYTAPLGVINSISAEGGNTATVGVTWSGAVITFAIGSGPATNVTMQILGF